MCDVCNVRALALVSRQPFFCLFVRVSVLFCYLVYGPLELCRLRIRGFMNYRVACLHREPDNCLISRERASHTSMCVFFFSVCKRRSTLNSTRQSITRGGATWSRFLGIDSHTDYRHVNKINLSRCRLLHISYLLVRSRGTLEHLCTPVSTARRSDVHYARATSQQLAHACICARHAATTCVCGL